MSRFYGTWTRLHVSSAVSHQGQCVVLWMPVFCRRSRSENAQWSDHRTCALTSSNRRMGRAMIAPWNKVRCLQQEEHAHA